MSSTRASTLAQRALRRALARLARSGPVLVPEYPLDVRARWGWGASPLRAVEERIAAHPEGYTELVEDVCSLHEWAATIARTSSNGREPCWENDFWGTVDALVQCAALRRRNPPLYLEIGSGYSTLFARKAIEDFGLRTRIVAIDPEPRTEVAHVCDRVIRGRLEDAWPGEFSELSADDIVLFDGSHVALANTDATVFLLEILPQLPVGVLVGIDDVFLPWDYPPGWETRAYGEQYLIAAQLLGGGEGWRLRFPAWWLVEHSELGKRFEQLWPIVENRFGRHAGSLWLERT